MLKHIRKCKIIVINKLIAMWPPFDPAIKKGRPVNKPRIVVFCPALLVVLGSGVRSPRANMCCAGPVLVTPGPGFRANGAVLDSNRSCQKGWHIGCTAHYHAYTFLFMRLPPLGLDFKTNSLSSTALIKTTGLPFFVTVTSSLFLLISATIAVACARSSETVINLKALTSF